MLAFCSSSHALWCVRYAVWYCCFDFVSDNCGEIESIFALSKFSIIPAKWNINAIKGKKGWLIYTTERETAIINTKVQIQPFNVIFFSFIHTWISEFMIFPPSKLPATPCMLIWSIIYIISVCWRTRPSAWHCCQWCAKEAGAWQAVCALFWLISAHKLLLIRSFSHFCIHCLTTWPSWLTRGSNYTWHERRNSFLGSSILLFFSHIRLRTQCSFSAGLHHYVWKVQGKNVKVLLLHLLASSGGNYSGYFDSFDIVWPCGSCLP